ncbi:hypothetical protein BZZ01_15530 [Nostocales cyanobacterium HT-58-2]|nr:hypothetical protein BZZ01_15530 [Nostocales cyanobacterium HT-58-2]
MKLIYRGMTYNYDPSKATGRPFQQVRRSGSAYNLYYRGLTYRVDTNDKPAEVPVLPIMYELIYRGISYFVNRTAYGKVTVVSQPISAPKLGELSVSEEF